MKSRLHKKSSVDYKYIKIELLTRSKFRVKRFWKSCVIVSIKFDDKVEWMSLTNSQFSRFFNFVLIHSSNSIQQSCIVLFCFNVFNFLTTFQYQIYFSYRTQCHRLTMLVLEMWMSTLIQFFSISTSTLFMKLSRNLFCKYNFIFCQSLLLYHWSIVHRTKHHHQSISTMLFRRILSSRSFDNDWEIT